MSGAGQTTTREQAFADQIKRLREQHPMLGDSYWEGVERERRLQWQLEDLTNGIAELAGKFRYHSEQDPKNTRLAELVAELHALIGVGS